jgi:hypothetical protein
MTSRYTGRKLGNFALKEQSTRVSDSIHSAFGDPGAREEARLRRRAAELSARGGDWDAEEAIHLLRGRR